MTRQTDGKSLYEQQEEQILAQSDAFISLLTKRGILGDHKIDNDKIRKAQQEKNRKSYHNTQLLLQHYRNIAWLLECLPMDIAKELEEPYEDIDKLIDHSKPIFSMCLDIATAPYTALMDIQMTAEDFTFAGVEAMLMNGLTTLIATISVVGLLFRKIRPFIIPIIVTLIVVLLFHCMLP